MNLDLDEVLSGLERVRRCGSGWVARCPAHDDHNPSLSIGRGDDGKALLTCHAGCPYQAIVDALGGRPWSRAFGLPMHNGSPPRTPLTDFQRTELALRLWREAKPAANTLVGRYLSARGIKLGPPPSIRFAPNLKHPTGSYLPAMIAGVQGPDRKLVAIHRTFLATDGSGKACIEPAKMALGPIRGGAVRLARAGDTLVLCEGIETGLSILQATNLPVWVALGTSNLSAIEVPDSTEEIIIAVDADPAGEKAAQQAAARFARSGFGVRIARPVAGDFNDVLQAGQSC
jgi:putative DNA primase/helicase